MADGSNTTMMEALTSEAAQILQDMSAVISRQAHLVEQLALMQREERLIDGLRSGALSVNEVREAPAASRTLWGGSNPERGIPLDQVGALRDSLRSETQPVVIDDAAGNCENQKSQANAAAEAEGTITAQPPEAEAVSRVAPGRTGDGATEAGAAPSEASDAGSQADEAAEGVAVGGDESGTAAPQDEPIAIEAPAKTRKEIVLDRYAETGDDKHALAKFSSSAVGSVEIYIAQARKSGDPRAAQGDLKRIQRQEEPQRQLLAAHARASQVLRNPPSPSPEVSSSSGAAAYRMATQPKTVEPHEADIGKPLCRIDTINQVVDGPDDEAPLRGPWLKVVGMMADQRRFTSEEITAMAGAKDQAALAEGMKRANLALAETGLTIHDCDGMGLYQLRKLL